MNSVSIRVGTDRDGQQMVPGLHQEGQEDFTGKEAFQAGREVDDVAMWHKSSKSLDALSVVSLCGPQSPHLENGNYESPQRMELL